MTSRILQLPRTLATALPAIRKPVGSTLVPMLLTLLLLSIMGCDTISPSDGSNDDDEQQKIAPGTTWSYSIVVSPQGLPSSQYYETTTLIEYLSQYNGKQNVARIRSEQSGSGASGSQESYVKFESNGDVSTHKVAANIDGKEYWSDDWIVSPYGSKGSKSYSFDTISSTGKRINVEGSITYIDTETIFVLDQEYEGVVCELEQTIRQDGVEIASTTGEAMYVPELGIEVQWTHETDTFIKTTIEATLSEYTVPD